MNDQTNAAPATPPDAPKPAKPRGFAAMSPERQREIASRGGKAAHESGKGHRWTKDSASAAGTKGGRVSGARRRLATAKGA